MKKIILFITAVFIVGSLSACALWKDKPVEGGLPLDQTLPEEVAKADPHIFEVDAEGSSKFDSGLLEKTLESNEKYALSEAEVQGIKFMLEEEKLARDVYAKLFEKWSLVIFDNISSSEHTHVSAVNSLALKYGIDIAFYDNGLGKFTNSHLKEVYNSLIIKGQKSPLEALKVGAEVEELDITDLESYLKETDNPDIKLVYENLQKASRNHLRAFVKNILRQGETYEAQKLDKEVFEGIISSGNENGKL